MSVVLTLIHGLFPSDYSFEVEYVLQLHAAVVERFEREIFYLKKNCALHILFNMTVLKDIINAMEKL